MRCPECDRSQTDSDARFCGRCGTKLPTRVGQRGASRWAAAGIAVVVVLAPIVAIQLISGEAPDADPRPAAVDVPVESVHLGVTRG